MATLGNELYMMEEDTIEKIGMKIIELEKVIHFTENPEEKKHLREKESQLREKERQLREKENLQLQLQLKSLSHPKRQKMGEQSCCKSSVLDNGVQFFFSYMEGLWEQLQFSTCICPSEIYIWTPSSF